MSNSAFSIAAIAWRAMPPRDCVERVASTALTSSISIGFMPITPGISASIPSDRPGLPKLSLYSDQPTMPSSVTSLRNEKVRQPASHLKTSYPLTFIVSSKQIPRHPDRSRAQRLPRAKSRGGVVEGPIHACAQKRPGPSTPLRSGRDDGTESLHRNIDRLGNPAPALDLLSHEIGEPGAGLQID